METDSIHLKLCGALEIHEVQDHLLCKMSHLLRIMSTEKVLTLASQYHYYLPPAFRSEPVLYAVLGIAVLTETKHQNYCQRLEIISRFNKWIILMQHLFLGSYGWTKHFICQLCPNGKKFTYKFYLHRMEKIFNELTLQNNVKTQMAFDVVMQLITFDVVEEVLNVSSYQNMKYNDIEFQLLNPRESWSSKKQKPRWYSYAGIS